MLRLQMRHGGNYVHHTLKFLEICTLPTHVRYDYHNTRGLTKMDKNDFEKITVPHLLEEFPVFCE